MKSNTFKTLQEQMKFHRHLFSFHLSFFLLFFALLKSQNVQWELGKNKTIPLKKQLPGKKKLLHHEN